MEDWCGVLGRLCGGQGEMITCYLCLDEIHYTAWTSGDHRRHCASRNTAQLSTFPLHQTRMCARCGAKLRLWPAQGPSFTCDSRSCENKNKLVPSTGDNRYNCFKCDFDLCSDCSRKSTDETEEKQNGHTVNHSDKQDKTKEEAAQELTDKLEEDENKNCPHEESKNDKRMSILADDDDNIPLIDVQSSAEDLPELVSISNKRPKASSFSQRPTAIDSKSRSITSLGVSQDNYAFPAAGGLVNKKMVADSPDIFNLRAPLVSCENFLTPATSKEAINLAVAEEINSK